MNKYKSSWTEVDGIKFQSKWEAEYWQVLRSLERAKLIDKLRRQLRYPLVVNGRKVGTSVIDFRFIELDEDGNPLRFRLQDTKGFIGKDTNTQLWKIKHAIIEATTGLTVEIIQKKNFRGSYEEDQSLSALDRRIHSQLAAVPKRRRTRS